MDNLDTSEAVNMKEMFYNCNQLTNLDLSNFNTANTSIMESMFSGCSSLNSLNLSSFNTANVTNMGYMFMGCHNMKELDISSFYINTGTNLQSMFYNLTNLETLKLGVNFRFISDPRLAKTWRRDGDNTIYTASELMANYNGSTMTGTYRAVVKLTISETVKGSVANINKNFNFTINVTKDGVGINTTHAYTGSKTGNLVFNNGVATFTLKHNENISVYLPGGNDYIITQNSDGYTLSKTNDIGTLSTDKTATFTDTLNGTTPSGIFINLIPYILIVIIGTISIFWVYKFKRI